MTLAPANFVNHWCLLAIFPQLRMMMYLDSLYHGAHARESFQRMQNFLQCSQQFSKEQHPPLDWKEWLFYNIPSQDLSQQTNSDDCGVFVLKWAQHIALSFPLDFTQNDIESFRYSMILEICAGDPRLRIELTSIENQVRNETGEEHASTRSESEEKSKKKTMISLKRKSKSCSLQDFLDSDDDFQQAKKVKPSCTKDSADHSSYPNTQTKKVHYISPMITAMLKVNPASNNPTQAQTYHCILGTFFHQTTPTNFWNMKTKRKNILQGRQKTLLRQVSPFAT